MQIRVRRGYVRGGGHGTDMIAGIDERSDSSVLWQHYVETHVETFTTVKDDQSGQGPR